MSLSEKKNALMQELNERFQEVALLLGFEKLANHLTFTDLSTSSNDYYQVGCTDIGYAPYVFTAEVTLFGEKEISISRGEFWTYPGWGMSNWGLHGSYE